jgi:hypothetical protein
MSAAAAAAQQVAGQNLVVQPLQAVAIAAEMLPLIVASGWMPKEQSYQLIRQNDTTTRKVSRQAG